MKRLLLLAWVISLAGCKPLMTLTPIPTPIYLRVAYHPALHPWASKLSHCGETMPEIALGFFEAIVAEDDTSPTNSDIWLQFANGIPEAQFVTQVGSEPITWIVHSSNPVEEATFSQITGIYTGKLNRWIQIAPEASDALIELWIYPPGDPMNARVESSFPGSRANLTGAYIAPDPGRLVEAVSNQPDALGFLPARWLTEISTNLLVKPIKVTGINDMITLDVLAVMPEEPDEEIRSLLLCLKEQK
jgi:hypothetical protein